MERTTGWFDSLYLENAPLMVGFVTRRFGDRLLAEVQTDEAFGVLLSRREERSAHPNLPGWLWKLLEGLPRDRMEGVGENRAMGALAALLRDMEEADFTPAMVKVLLGAEEQPFDAQRALRAFHRRNATLFEGQGQQGANPPERRRTGRALAAPAEEMTEREGDAPESGEETSGTVRKRGAAVRLATAAAAALLLCAAVLQGVAPLLVRPEPEKHWEEVDGLLVGDFQNFAQMLAVNGVDLPMAPTLLPEPEDAFGPLEGAFSAVRFDGYDLFTAKYRDGDGKGYAVRITRRDDLAVADPGGASVKGAREYVCDGVAYHIIPDGTGTYHMRWNRGGLAGQIDGDLDQTTAMALARSITRTPQGRRLGTPERPAAPEPLAVVLEEHGLDTALAPSWLPRDLEAVDRFVTGAGYGTNVAMVHSEYRGSGERVLVLQTEWWVKPSRPVPPAFQWEGSSFETRERHGIKYTQISDGYAQIISWRKGRLSCWLYGNLSTEELWRIADSIAAGQMADPSP